MLLAQTSPEDASAVLSFVGGIPLLCFGVFLLVNPRDYAIQVLGAIHSMAFGAVSQMRGNPLKPVPPVESRRRMCLVLGGAIVGVGGLAFVASAVQLLS